MGIFTTHKNPYNKDTESNKYQAFETVYKRTKSVGNKLAGFFSSKSQATREKQVHNYVEQNYVNKTQAFGRKEHDLYQQANLVGITATMKRDRSNSIDFSKSTPTLYFEKQVDQDTKRAGHLTQAHETMSNIGYEAAEDYSHYQRTNIGEKGKETMFEQGRLADPGKGTMTHPSRNKFTALNDLSANSKAKVLEQMGKNQQVVKP